jgi:hypothetical protein
LPYSSTLKMKAAWSPEMSFGFQRTTRRYKPEDRNLHLQISVWRLAVLVDFSWLSLDNPVKCQDSTTGRTIAQAVSCRLPTAMARVQNRVWSCGILWWTKLELGQVFSENFGFPCQSTFHLLLHNHLHYHPRLAQ